MKIGIVGSGGIVKVLLDEMQYIFCGRFIWNS